MSEFFHGWRRKAGCMTLVMALAFTAVWMRSLTCDDVVDGWLSRHSTIHLISSDSALNIAYAWDDGTDPHYVQADGTIVCETLMDRSKPVDWKTFPVEATEISYFAWDGDFCGLSFAAKDYFPIHRRAVRVPDVYFAIPLTLVSAWFLLSRRQKSTPTSSRSKEAIGA